MNKFFDSELKSKGSYQLVNRLLGVVLVHHDDLLSLGVHVRVHIRIPSEYRVGRRKTAGSKLRMYQHSQGKIRFLIIPIGTEGLE